MQEGTCDAVEMLSTHNLTSEQNSTEAVICDCVTNLSSVTDQGSSLPRVTDQINSDCFDGDSIILIIFIVLLVLACLTIAVLARLCWRQKKLIKTLTGNGLLW